MPHHGASTPSSTLGQSAGPECRTARRYPCRRVVLVGLDDAVGRSVSVAYVRDISADGLGLLLRRDVEPGSLLTLERPARGKSGTLLAKVVHRKYTPTVG